MLQEGENLGIIFNQVEVRMQISRKTVYAIKAITYISAFKNKRLCTITEVAEFEGIPREYLAKILKELAQKGILASFKGVKGGYRINKDRKDITFLNILETVQEPTDRPIASGPGSKKNIFKGASFKFWKELDEAMTSKLKSMNMDKIDYKPYANID